MSIRALTALAVERDRADAGTPALGGSRGGEPTTSPTAAETNGTSPGPAATGVPQSFTDALTSAIPTEPLAAYTALIAVVTAAVGSDPRSYLPFRWWAFFGFLGLTAAATVIGYRQKSIAASPSETNASAGNQRPAPWLELGTALVAAAAWGLAMPGGPFSAQFTGPAQLLATGSTLVLGASLVTLAATPLTRGTEINRTPADAGRQPTTTPGSAPLTPTPPTPTASDHSGAVVETTTAANS
ncbi:MAG: hypothetical protein QOG20_2030 [Pseudonocardiales bacterium]|jgi:hypothetical protein|nr:hypothetical protein [Pseudonocardiales bacterium]